MASVTKRETSRGARYDVRYREFDGGHEAPPTVMWEGVGFFLEGV